MPANTSLIDKITANPRTIFLIDAAGAIVSALSLYALILPFNNYFGVPDQIIWILGGVSLLFFGFSLGCFLSPGKNNSTKLKIIISANILYGVLTAVLISLNRAEVTGLGIAYFIAEYTVILALVTLEQQCLKKLNSSK